MKHVRHTIVGFDQHGNQLGPEKDIPTPDSFPTAGLEQVESYVSRLLHSTARFTSLIIATPDEQTAVLLSFRGGVPEITICVDWRLRPELESGIRKFFADRGHLTVHDYLAGNGDIPDATRCLSYHLSPESQLITELTRDLLKNIYGLQDEDALNFSFEEHKPA